MERTFEDHENVIEALSHWPKVHHNTIHFRYNPEKYLLLTKPQVFISIIYNLPSMYVYACMYTCDYYMM